MGQPSSKDVVKAFLSCSVRKADRPIVDAIEKYVLQPLGFECLTVGRNISLPLAPDDTIKKVLSTCDCLIGVATVRHRASDVASPDTTLALAAPYVLQETSMAFQAGMPFLMFRTPEVQLQGVTTKHLYLSIQPDLSASGRPRFSESHANVSKSLGELKQQALAYKRSKVVAGITDQVKTVATVLGGGILALAGFDWLQRPNCFGTFDYRKQECKGCEYKGKCKVKKADLRESNPRR